MAPGGVAAVLLVGAVASVGVGGSGIERAGSIVQVASGPAATPGGGSISQAGDDAGQLEAEVLGRPTGRDGGEGSAGGRGGGGADGDDGSGEDAAGPGGADQPSGAPEPAGGADAGPGSEATAPGEGAPTGGQPAGSGAGGPIRDTVDGVTDQIPDLPKPVPDDVGGGILDDPKLPGGLDRPKP